MLVCVLDFIGIDSRVTTCIHGNITSYTQCTVTNADYRLILRDTILYYMLLSLHVLFKPAYAMHHRICLCYLYERCQQWQAVRMFFLLFFIFYFYTESCEYTCATIIGRYTCAHLPCRWCYCDTDGFKLYLQC